MHQSYISTIDIYISLIYLTHTKHLVDHLTEYLIVRNDIESMDRKKPGIFTLYLYIHKFT